MKQKQDGHVNDIYTEAKEMLVKGFEKIYKKRQKSLQKAGLNEQKALQILLETYDEAVTRGVKDFRFTYKRHPATEGSGEPT